jgi:hypothetical protein
MLIRSSPNQDLIKLPLDYPCRFVHRTKGVAVLRLETILCLIPQNIRIELIKVDAQGVDLEVVSVWPNHLFCLV